jgi:muramoyltetrapeptide carboxypeptidase
VIGIVAPSSVVPKIELKLGLEWLDREGLKAKVHPNTHKIFRFFAGTDAERAQALYDYAVDPECDVIWCARGGYGAQRILPLLEQLSLSKGDPRPGKLLIGYSDATALFEYVRKEWGWSALHAPMPGLRSFLQFKKEEWKALSSWVSRARPDNPWGPRGLKHMGGASARIEICSELIGGNLMVWTSLLGTKYFPETMGKILFFEDVLEYPYRIDRLVSQLELAGAFEGVCAVVLGDFLQCADSVSLMLASMPKKGLKDPAIRKPSPKMLKPLRKKLDEKKVIPEIFSEVGARHGFPVFAGLPVGHGPGHFSLPIGARYRLNPSGHLALDSWDWLR